MMCDMETCPDYFCFYNGILSTRSKYAPAKRKVKWIDVTVAKYMEIDTEHAITS